MTENKDKEIEKNKKFRDLANTRVKNAVRKIQLVANLSNTYNYNYSNEDAKKIISAIKSEYDDLDAAFKKGMKKNKAKEFSL